MSGRVFPAKTSKPLTLPFTYAGTIYETKGGLKAGTGTTLYFRGGGLKTMGFEYVSPDEVTLGNDLQQQAYCHLLCGLLRCEEVEQVYGLFAYTVVEGLRMLEQVSCYYLIGCAPISWLSIPPHSEVKTELEFIIVGVASSGMEIYTYLHAQNYQQL